MRRLSRADALRERRALLERLSEVEALETYLHKAFLGKQFSIEGLDSLVPMLDEVIELGASSGAREVVLGMAHRRRLNVLAHTVGRPTRPCSPSSRASRRWPWTPRRRRRHRRREVPLRREQHALTGSGRSVTVTLSPNPSHLEYVNPVIEGRARADQTGRKARDLFHDPSAVVPVLIHGDAAFPGRDRLRDAQPAGAVGLLDRRHDPPDR